MEEATGRPGAISVSLPDDCKGGCPADTDRRLLVPGTFEPEMPFHVHAPRPLFGGLYPRLERQGGSVWIQIPCPSILITGYERIMSTFCGTPPLPRATAAPMPNAIREAPIPTPTQDTDFQLPTRPNTPTSHSAASDRRPSQESTLVDLSPELGDHQLPDNETVIGLHRHAEPDSISQSGTVVSISTPPQHKKPTCQLQVDSDEEYWGNLDQDISVEEYEELDKGTIRRWPVVRLWSLIPSTSRRAPCVQAA